MNRKRVNKLEKKVEQTAKLHFSNPLNDPISWLTDTPPCPWTPEQIAAFQKQLDSAFGAENAIVLAWSLNRKYWDEFYEDWFPNGLPKGKLHKKPILLWKEVPVNNGADHLYISTPRWLLLERLHGSELEASWGDSSWVQNGETIGGQRRIRAEKPPKDFYQVLRTIAEHEQSLTTERQPPCCRRLWEADRSICYGKYRPPSEIDVAHVRRIRQRMDADGVAQRNDAPRQAKMLARAAASTQHFMRQAEIRKATAVKEMILGDPQGYMVDILKNYKIDISAKELDSTLREGLERAEEQRFEQI